MKQTTQAWGSVLAIAAMLGSLAAPNLAHAGSKGRKNTAIGLGAATIHQAVKGKTTNAVILGAGTAYAYKRYKDAKKEENRSRRASEVRSESYARTARYAADDSSETRTRSYRSSQNYGAASTRSRRNRHSHVNPLTGKRYYHRHSGSQGHIHHPKARRLAAETRTTTRTRRTRTRAGTIAFTGKIVDDTDRVTRNISVESKRGTVYRINVPENVPIIKNGKNISVHNLDDNDWIRVRAYRSGPNRWRAVRINVVRYEAR
ncbi:MAG: hypothetical protein KY468_12535 [Armatimonadetes bacterium]|nr:hypothetical protein [Armatimonadota bacterium]